MPDISDRALCSTDDVRLLVPGYEPDNTTLDALITLINAESVEAYRRTGREFVALAGNNLRVYEISAWNVRERRVRIHDAAAITTVKILDVDETTELETVNSADRVSLPRTRDEWEPIRQLKFLTGSPAPAQLACGRLVQVTATWGFPQVPDDLPVAIAKLVLVRYIAAVANDGTSLSEALNQIGFDAAIAFASAQAVLRGYANPALA